MTKKMPSRFGMSSGERPSVVGIAEGARPLDRTSPFPLWAQMEADLRRRLSLGEFCRRFPTDLELAVLYGVSRQTARRAVCHLNSQGLVTRQRGGATVVNPGCGGEAS